MIHSEKNPPIPSMNPEDKGFLTLRIKPNLPLPSSSNTDPTLTISTDATVYTLKQTISNQLHFQKRYIRLIHSGRLLAPDDAILKSFGMKNDAVVHCVVAKEGVSGGIQAKLANRTSVRNHSRLPNNNNTNHHQQQQPNEVVDRRSGIGSDGRIQPRRRVRRSLLSIGTSNVSTSSTPQDELESDDDSNDDEEEYDEERGQGQFRRERRGFDRLRDQGLSRSEVHAVRIYFSNQVDAYIAATDNTDTTANDTTNTTNDTTTTAANQEEGDHNHHSRRGQSHSNGNGMTTTDQEHDYDPETALQNRRLRAEEEWMDLQGPYSEFRLNLNADNPFMHRLWMDLGGVGVGGQQRRRRQRRPRGEGGQDDNDNDQEEEETRFQRPTSTTNTTTGFHMYGPLGTDRDFIWGFVLAYLCGFMMMFWVMNPTVAHRQKLGILTGLCFHILLHMFEHAHDDNDDYSKAVLEQETLLG